MAATTPKQHIEEIRKTKFSIGGEMNPLTEDLLQAVKNLSAEVYAKDVHFLMELIQIAEDNDYSDGGRVIAGVCYHITRHNARRQELWQHSGY